MKYFLIGIAVLGVSACAWLLYKHMNEDSIACSSVKIVAFGDSLVTGHGASGGEDAFSVLSSLAGSSIQNLGRSGDTTASARDRIASVTSLSPDIVFVLLGGNDALQGVSLAETERNLSSILMTLTESGAQPILIGIIGGYPTDPYAPLFERLADEYAVPFVPNILSGLFGRDEYMSDAIHPNAAGYRRIAERLQPVLLSACENTS